MEYTMMEFRLMRIGSYEGRKEQIKDFYFFDGKSNTLYFKKEETYDIIKFFVDNKIEIKRLFIQHPPEEEIEIRKKIYNNKPIYFKNLRIDKGQEEFAVDIAEYKFEKKFVR